MSERLSSSGGHAVSTKLRRDCGCTAGFCWFMPVILSLLIASALAARTKTPARLTLSAVWGAPSWSNPFGFGEGGVDVAAFVGHACLRVLGLSGAVAVVSAVLGMIVGAHAALRRGQVERLLMRSCDLVQAFPTFLLALTVLSAVDAPSRWHLGIVFLLTAWAPFARMAHAQAKWIEGAEFVLAARAMGAGRWQTLTRHVLPHLVGPISVQLGSCAAGIVLSESALGFVGLGPSDGVSLGALLEQGTVAMLRDGRVLGVAATAIAVTSGSLQLASEGLRRRLVRQERR